MKKKKCTQEIFAEPPLNNSLSMLKSFIWKKTQKATGVRDQSNKKKNLKKKKIKMGYLDIKVPHKKLSNFPQF